MPQKNTEKFAIFYFNFFKFCCCAIFSSKNNASVYDQGLRFYHLHKLVGSVGEEVGELDDLKAVGLIEPDSDVLTPFLHNLSTLTKLKMEVVAL